jgi:hypothetical protein
LDHEPKKTRTRSHDPEVLEVPFVISPEEYEKMEAYSLFDASPDEDLRAAGYLVWIAQNQPDFREAYQQMGTNLVRSAKRLGLAVEFAAEKCNQKVFEWLLALGPISDMEFERAVEKAAFRESEAMVRVLLNKNTDGDCESALQRIVGKAALHGNKKSVHYLLGLGNNPVITEDRYVQALFKYAKNGDFQIVRIILGDHPDQASNRLLALLGRAAKSAQHNLQFARDWAPIQNQLAKLGLDLLNSV